MVFIVLYKFVRTLIKKVCERERERGAGREGGREREGEREREREVNINCLYLNKILIIT